MAGRFQLRRGTTAQNNAFTGAVGELTFDTETNGIRVHDGHTQGGLPFNTVTAFQRPTAANNWTWYRVWSDGWVEQGCMAPTNVTANGTNLNFPITMKSDAYIATITPINFGGDGIGVSIVSRYTTYLVAKNKNYGSSNTVPCVWKVEGEKA